MWWIFQEQITEPHTVQELQGRFNKGSIPLLRGWCWSFDRSIDLWATTSVISVQEACSFFCKWSVPNQMYVLNVDPPNDTTLCNLFSIPPLIRKTHFLFILYMYFFSLVKLNDLFQDYYCSARLWNLQKWVAHSIVLHNMWQVTPCLNISNRMLSCGYP